MSRWRKDVLLKPLPVALLAFASIAVADCAATDAPTGVDFDFARVKHLHEVTGLGGMAHCGRFKALRCTRAPDNSADFRCTYRVPTASGSWERKSAVLRKDGSDWLWVAGDGPKNCSITLFN